MGAAWPEGATYCRSAVLGVVIQLIQPWLASKVLFPAYHFLKRDGMLKAIDSLVQGQWSSEQELRELQVSKLEKLVNHCEQHVPYYKKLFAEQGLKATDLLDPTVFSRLPYLTKDVIREHQAALCADNVSGNRLIANSTSGSTGVPMKFFHDYNSAIWRGAVVWRNQEWTGALFSDREVRLWGAQMDISRAESLRGRLHAALFQKVYLSSYEMSDDSMKRYAAVIRRFRPRLLISYASPLATFAEYFQRTGEQVPFVPAIITSAETLHPWQRELIEGVFKTQIFDRYGCREFGNIAHQCEVHDGYHVNIERFFVEIVDSEGHPVREGEVGEVLITDLDNFGFPFVRYSIGDLGVMTTEACSCGRGLPLIKRFEGRSFDVIECPNGQRIAGTYWTIVLRRFTGVRQFQVIQDAPEHLTIRLRIGEDWVAGTEADISHQIKEVCGDDMAVDYEFSDHFELTKSGKSRLVINQLH